MRKTFIIDIDGTICNNTNGDYKNAKPYRSRISKINALYEQGHHIIYWTSRGMSTGLDWEELTMAQLKEWGCLHHELRMDKPMYDHWIDDKARNADVLGDW
jgi:uncharacterized HAD superfamily protein